MKLISVGLHGYKRFEQPSSMNVDGKLVAVIGPNESGKSSFLDALMHLNDRDPFVRSGGSQELTRDVSIPDDQTVVEARYLLEDNDREVISHLHGAEEVRWFTIKKKPKGKPFICDVDPKPKRNLEPRQQVIRALTETSTREVFLEKVAVQPDLRLIELVEDLASALDTDAETLPDESKEKIKSLAATLESAAPERDLESLPLLVKQLNDLADHEEGSPHLDAIHALVERRPHFLLFTDEERALQSEYNLNEVWENPPAALSNLARVANLDLENLYEAIAANEHARVESIEERANRELRRVFFEAWSQSPLTVRFSINGQVLHLLIQEEFNGESSIRFTSIAERSDGLRQFVALLAFATLKKPQQVPILLIDEAETHLHYDAQADLVQMLARQTIVSKVIYTTHSIGCLPEDLGTGVRLIKVKNPYAYTSTIRNWFWQADRPGFSPLLFGMGASTLAFIPVRYAVITEGIADVILWPTLLREATGLSYLDFQIVPGLSEANYSEIIQLDREAPHTAYLIDSDTGGKALRKQLIEAGVSEQRVFLIPDNQEQGLVAEDLVDPEVYLEAVNNELHRTHGLDFSFPKGKLPTANRPKAIRDWCGANGIGPPSKRAVAYQVLESGVGKSILAQHHSRPLQELYSRIESLLHDSAT